MTNPLEDAETAFKRGDYRAASHVLYPLAYQGNPDAQFFLGSLYDGTHAGIEKDDAEAAKWFAQAAERGHGGAQYNLATMYQAGTGVAQDLAQAEKWYRKAALKGLSWAQANLALMYDHGDGVPQNHVEAYKWYRKAADQGHSLAQCNLGLKYHGGQGVPQDYIKARKFFLLAAKQGLALAQYNLGVLYDKGRGITQSYKEAAQWFLKAAEQGHAAAQFNLGILYMYGRGVAQDMAQAADWFGKASVQGHAEAASSLEFVRKVAPLVLLARTISASDRALLKAGIEGAENRMITAQGSENDQLWSAFKSLAWMREELIEMPLKVITEKLPKPSRVFVMTPEGRIGVARFLSLLPAQGGTAKTG